MCPLSKSSTDLEGAAPSKEDEIWRTPCPGWFQRVGFAVLAIWAYLILSGHVDAIKQHRDLLRPLLGEQESDMYLYYPRTGHTFRGYTPSRSLSVQPRPRTPLIVPFTKNEALLIQTVLSYMAAGWPREDIIVLDNTGTMDANPRGELSTGNPFRLDYRKFRDRYGISILQTPTLLSTPQIQNFMLRLAMSKGWSSFFWSHPDILVLSDEMAIPYRSFHSRVVDILQGSHQQNRVWAAKFLGSDSLVLVNVDAWRDVGQWDTFLPYYHAECDAYSRARMMGYTIENATAGWVFKVSTTLDDPETTLFPRPLISEPAVGRFWSGRYQLTRGSTQPLGAGTQKQEMTVAERRVKVHRGSSTVKSKRQIQRMPHKPSTEHLPGSQELLLALPDRYPDSNLDNAFLVMAQDDTSASPTKISRRDPLLNPDFAKLLSTLRGMAEVHDNSVPQPEWSRTTKGAGEPWTYDPLSFEAAEVISARQGREMYHWKWDSTKCDLLSARKSTEDAWKDRADVHGYVTHGPL